MEVTSGWQPDRETRLHPEQPQPRPSRIQSHIERCLLPGINTRAGLPSRHHWDGAFVTVPLGDPLSGKIRFPDAHCCQDPAGIRRAQNIAQSSGTAEVRGFPTLFIPLQNWRIKRFRKQSPRASVSGSWRGQLHHCKQPDSGLHRYPVCPMPHWSSLSTRPLTGECTGDSSTTNGQRSFEAGSI